MRSEVPIGDVDPADCIIANPAAARALHQLVEAMRGEAVGEHVGEPTRTRPSLRLVRDRGPALVRASDESNPAPEPKPDERSRYGA